MAAAPVGLFEVRGVAVDFTAATAAAAREQAVAKGARDAFWQLIDRLTLSSDRAKVGQVSDAEIETMIQDLSVAGEKYSSVRYLATLDFTFKEDEVRSLLSRKGVPYAVTQAKTIVVLPLLRSDDALVLWEEPNPWFGAWRSLPGGQLVPVMVPLGDLTDVEIIGAEEAAVGEPEKIALITTRYQASEALVPFAVLDASTASGAAEVAVALTLYGPEGPRKGPTRRYVAAEGEDVDQLLARAAEATMTEVQNQWKRENLVVAGGQASMESVAVPITSLSDWLTVRRRLERVQTIERIDVVLLSRSLAVINIHHFGTAEQLGLALEQADLILRQGAEGLVLTPRPQRS
ncbi:MAG TPA: DUF2066 domain-containing protein [Rhodospirillales bacterium]|nr:DUF2066 domain-containing protein [Rhodospirillales bacterium]